MAVIPNFRRMLLDDAWHSFPRNKYGNNSAGSVLSSKTKVGRLSQIKAFLGVKGLYATEDFDLNGHV